MDMGRNRSHKNVPQPKKLRKDPGVPKLIALKAKAEISAYKRKPNHRSVLTQQDGTQDSMEIVPSISTLASMAAAAEAEDLEQSNESLELRAISIQRRQYLHTLHKVVEQSDVIIMVLDARDPEGCRSRLVEDEVRRREADGKRLIFVLNKIDLVPKENAQAWLKYLRHSAPTLPFRSSTQSQRQNLSSRTSPALMNLLKSFKPPNKSISVGVVGYPNVGKSSLINSLKRAKVCPVAAEPGWTKELQSVAVERGLRIIDSPGVIFDDSDPSLATTQPSSISQASRILLLNVLSASSMPDPIQIVQAILSRTSHETLQSLYSLPSFSADPASAPGGDNDEAMEDIPVVTKFLTMLALTSGRLLPGGTPNLEAAATQVLRDWNSGKIPYFTPVPEFHPSVRPSDTPGAENVGDMKVVNEWKPAFDLGGLLDAADQQAWNDDPIVDEDEAEYMAEDGLEMEEDSRLPDIPHKRAYTERHDEVTNYENGLEASLDSSLATSPPLVAGSNRESEYEQQIKRVKKANLTYDMELNQYEASTMADSNPLSRKKLRQQAKKGRKLLMKGQGRRQEMAVDHDT